MKIAINTLGPSKLKVGIGNYVFHLVHELAKIDKVNEYIIFANGSNAHLFNVANKNFEVFLAPRYTKIKPLRILWEQLSLPRLVKKLRVDVLHSPGFVAPLLMRTKSVVTIHDMTFFSHPQYHTKDKVKYFTAMMPLSAKRAHAIIADSDNTKREISRYLDVHESKITTVHLGVGKEFKPVDKEQARSVLKKKYQIKNKFILFVGMIEPRKNIAGLIDAFLKARQQFLKLVIVGEKGWDSDSVFSMVKELGLEEEVIFTGFVPDDDLVLFYNAAECFVYPSFYEGFGIPVIEAMACGCPAITSNTSSLQEIADKAALLVNPENTASIAHAIVKVLNDPLLRTKLVHLGFKRAQQFSWRTTAEKTLAVYKKVVQGKLTR